jgi:hypothetical protein
MSRWCALALSFSLVSLAASQEAPRPATKTDDPKQGHPKSAEKSADAGDVDVHKTAERIAENAQKAGDRLKEKDPGADTRKIQQDIIKDIDSLIKKAQEPPPPPKSDMSPMPPMMPPPKSDMTPPPMGGGGDPKQKNPMPMGGMGGSGDSPPKMGGGGGTGSQSKSGRRPRREGKERGGSPREKGDPMAKGSTGGTNPRPAGPDSKGNPAGRKDDRPSRDDDRFGLASPKRQNEKLADLYKDVWGHLPDRLRQEMDLYYREKFMPRYSELLRQYYAALAEQKKSGSEDR